jgi:hypothetical protein
MVQSPKLVIITNGKHQTGVSFTISETIRFRSLEFITDHFGRLSLSAEGNDSVIVFVGMTHSGSLSLHTILSYPVFMLKPSTHRMHDSGSIVPHIRPKVFTDNQISWIKYNYYISNVSKDYDDSQRNGTAKDSITPQEWQLEQHVA